jgi:hypothetical protein
MAVRLSALRTSRTLLPTNIIIFMFLVLISVGLSKPQNLVQLEGLGKFKKITSLAIGPATFRFVA